MNDIIREPVEHPIYKGYYFVNGMHFIISKDGEAINIKNGTKLNILTDKTGYTYFSTTRGISIHRALALTFIPKPERHKDKDYSILQVNHINGIKDDNRLENLEWVTNQENQLHAIENGLIKHKVVLARNIITNEIIEYPCASWTARVYDIKLSKLKTHLTSKKAGTLTKNWHVFKYKEDHGLWPKLCEYQQIENGINEDYGLCVAKCILTGKKFLGYSMRELCRNLNLNYNAANKTYRRQGKNNNYKGFNFTYINKETIGIINNYPSETLNFRSKGRKIKVINVRTNEIQVFDSVPKASKELNITKGTIEYYILKNTLYKNLRFEKI